MGGCVRDLLRGETPHDWDVCTSARPDEIEQVFFDLPRIDTGRKHGTMAVILDHRAVEITTFRADGGYLDHRHPATVTFLPDLAGDLARRDFTVNAMALDEQDQPIDLFGGQEDLKNHIIRTVGDPAERFREDGLRILRGLRFASRLDFEIEPKTARAMIEERELLNSISAERIFTELKGILVGQAAGRVLRAFAPVLFTILPELAPMEGFEQHSPYHDSDVWEHTLRAFEASPPDPVYRLALLFHDCGKPDCFFRDENGPGPFLRPSPQEPGAYGGGTPAAEMRPRDPGAGAVPHRKARHLAAGDREEHAPSPAACRGTGGSRDLLTVERCDALAHAPLGRDPALRNIDKWEQLLETVLQDTPCLSLQSLAVSGDDLLSLGMAPGPRMGQLLNDILERVADGDLKNDQTALLAYAKKHI